MCIPKSEAAAKSEAIDKSIKIESMESKTKIMLLGNLSDSGPGESGKSTILKQMILKYQHGFTEIQTSSYTSLISDNLRSATQSLLLKIEGQIRMTNGLVALVNTLNNKSIPLSAKVVMGIWNDDQIQPFTTRDDMGISDSIR